MKQDVIRLYRRIVRRYLRRPESTVRYAFPALVVFSAMLGAAVLMSSDASYVRISTEPSRVVSGEIFTISIYAHAGVPTNAVDIQVAYPREQLTIESIDVGESVITIWTEEPYARGGTIFLRGGVYRRGFLGEHLIARVKARAVESGVAHILASETQFLAGDGRGSVVEVAHTGTEKTNITVLNAGELKSDVSIGIVTDLDGDGDVDMSDIRAFLEAWHAQRSIFDFNGDGRMTFRDFGILLAHSFFR